MLSASVQLLSYQTIAIMTQEKDQEDILVQFTTETTKQSPSGEGLDAVPSLNWSIFLNKENHQKGSP